VSRYLLIVHSSGDKDPNVKMSGFIAEAISIAIWTMLIAIFLFDILTPPENLSVCLAYAVPIFVSVFELRPRTVLYASVSTVLSLVGLLIQPSATTSEVLIAANLSIAVAIQWLVAVLVRLLRQRLSDMLMRAESQRRLVNILSHEIGTALTVVSGQATRLLRLSAQPPPGEIKQRAEKIKGAALRIEAVINRIRFASSLDDGTIPVDQGAVNLPAIVRQLTEQLTEENQGRAIDLSLPAEPLIIDGDEVLIRQMIENVIMNSLKYSPAHAPVSVSVVEQKDTARIAVIDHGCGMSQYDLSRSRSSFYRGENSGGTSGTGIGLYVVDKIVEAHKGKLTVTSSLGAGTSVVIDLPAFRRIAST
jgi:signal transduction histidine kinase